MSVELTPEQTLLMWGLLAKQGVAAQADLMPAVKKADRETLERAKFVTVTKRSRALWLRLEDAGWGWAAGHLREPIPPAFGALQGMMARLHDHLARSGETLADFIGAAPEPVEAGKPTKTAGPPKRERVTKKSPEDIARAAEEKEVKAQAAEERKRAAGEKKRIADEKKTLAAENKRAREAAKLAPKPKKVKAPSPTAIRKRLEDAYLSVTGGRKNESVRLARLRAELEDLDRETVDAALGRILASDRKASLMRHDDPRQIDKADEEAAYSPGGEPFHVLWIAS